MRGQFIKRYNRFLADIETTSGEIITAYCPATGRMTTCQKQGAPVEYLRIQNSDRKLNYDWWSIKMEETWVVIDTRPANKWLYWYRSAPWLPDSWANARWVPEPECPGSGRFDFRLDHPSGKRTWIEIKSVTWCEDGVGLFPDAPTERGRRHLKELIQLRHERDNAVLVFMGMRSDIVKISPAESIDPEFSKLITQLKKEGAHILGIESKVDDRSVHLRGQVPVV